MIQLIKKKILIWLLLSVNLLFAFIIGLTIPLMESESRVYLGLFIIPLLILLNYICLDRFHYFLRDLKEAKQNSNEDQKAQVEKGK